MTVVMIGCLVETPAKNVNIVMAIQIVETTSIRQMTNIIVTEVVNVNGAVATDGRTACLVQVQTPLPVLHATRQARAMSVEMGNAAIAKEQVYVIIVKEKA